MGEFWGKLFSTDGFKPRKDCGDWSNELIGLHVGSDLFIWLAYLSIPLVLLYFTRRNAVPFSSLFLLAAAFILFCGFTHFTDALMFTTPVYRFAGLLKAATAVVSWAMVFALIPAVPRITAAIAAGGPAPGTAEHRPLAAARPGGWARGYIIALLAATLAVLVRASLNQILQNDRAYVLSLMAVVYVGWQCGFGPAVVTLLVSLVGMGYFFVLPRITSETALSDLMAAGLFFFCGVACAALGGSNRLAQDRAKASLAEANDRRAGLEVEMALRRTVEAELREREADFRLLADNISQLAWMTDPEGWIYWYNRRWFEYTGTTLDRMQGWGWKAVHHPDYVDRVVEKFARHVRSGEPWEDTFQLRGADGAYRWFLSRARPVRDEAGAVVRWFGTNTDITAQRDADQALREAQAGLEKRVAERTADLNREREFLRAVLENIEDAVVACDADGRLTLFNRATLTLHGLPPEPIPSEQWADHYALCHPDGATPMAPAEVPLYRALAGEHVRGAEMTVVPAGGGPVRALVASGQPLFDDAGRKLGAVVSMHDVTDRLAAEAARAEVIREQVARATLAQQEARLRALAEAVPQIVWVARPDGYHEYYNPRWYEFTGVPAGSTDGEGWNGLFHPDDQPRAWARWRHSLTTGENYEIEYRLRRHDGAYRWMLGLAQPQRDAAGAIIRWFGTCTDIDDAKRQAEALRQAADRFRTLTETIPQMVWNTDAAGHISYFNTRWRDYTGLTAGAAQDEWWQQVAHPDDAAELEPAWRRAVHEPPAAFAREIRVRRAADGAYRWFQAAVVPLRRDDGEIDQWIGSLSDIDDQKRQAETLDRLVRERTTELVEANAALRDQIEERRRAEEQVRAVARELQRSNGELEQFAYVASHDLQEPLRKIQAFGDLLGNKYSSQVPDQGREYIGKMQGSAGRMSRLIDDLLTFSRVTTHARPFARVDLNVILAEVVEDLELRIEKSGGTVDPGPLPAIDADPTQMRQLFLNLLGNALKFAQPGRSPVVTVRAEVATEPGPNGRPAEVCRVTVADNGIGFEDRHADRIFQVFQRLHGRGEYDGTGVGLAVCKKIVDRHGGAVVARGRVGEGATFVVTLPTRQPDPAAPPPART